MAYLSAGSFDRALAITTSSQRGESRRIEEMCGGGSVNLLTNPSFPEKGGLPTSIS